MTKIEIWQFISIADISECLSWGEFKSLMWCLLGTDSVEKFQNRKIRFSL